ncbi:hypothetical protein HAX54_006868 [Datura stramonium]|uniref:Uncharacterized protein n=1 Tax=Datura stramonium TaxID=4076 RepID=A0ABS8TBL5_DATST|nr:hypothetical protein [Datura stramonium]
MGNCMRSSREGKKVDEELAEKGKEESMMMRRKSVRYRVIDEKKAEEKKGVVRIRVVVTQEELKQILNGQLDFSSKDDFLTKIKTASSRGRTRRRRRLSLCEDGSFSTGKMKSDWRPVLETIPEDH